MKVVGVELGVEFEKLLKMLKDGVYKVEFVVESGKVYVKKLEVVE